MATRRFRRRSTTKAVLLALALAITGGVALVVSALANPSFSGDYTADAIVLNLLGPLSNARRPIPARLVIFGLNGLPARAGGKSANETAFSRKTEGDAFVDFTGNRLKFSLNSWCDVNPDCKVDAPVDIYNFYNNGTGYLFWLDTERTCWTHMSMYALPPMVEQADTFSGLVNATKLSTPCLQFSNSGTVGHQFHFEPGDGEVRDFCSSTDEKTPYWVTIQEEPGKKSTTVEFKTYNPGRPSPSVFRFLPGCGE